MIDRLKKVLILGSGALKIGEAGEFDYSGSQAIKALKDEGIRTILVNPNIATIQTSDYLADQIYLLPVSAYFVERVIRKEMPDGILLGFGGQTALNCGFELERESVLDRYGVRVLGTPIQAIRETEDRGLFVKKLAEIDVKVPRSLTATSVEQAAKAADAIGYPVMLRIAYALGGLGSGLCSNADEVMERAAKAFAQSSQLLIEEYLAGWKEVEYEVVRDRFDNAVTVCNMENFDPMGIHTGESIVVAPSQTLTNTDYHLLRRIAIQVVRHFGIVGECNIQFALDPYSQDYRVIEVNARLSRSSALASKATGYPLALVAAKLGLGMGLTDLRNSITGLTTACFEPALDYIVVKIPRWDLQKFHLVSRKVGSAMKSVGEVMAIGRKFEEALQKAVRMLEIGVDDLTENHFRFPNLERELREPTPERLFAIAQAMKQGCSVDRIHQLSHIDKWFLYKIENIVAIKSKIRATRGWRCSRKLLLEAKQAGFSDRQMGALMGFREERIRTQRQALSIVPRVRQIDTLAAEYPAQTNYLYLTYNGQENDIVANATKSVIVLGSGAYRIGSSVEFDWCCVNTALTLRELGYAPIIINSNPETVSTDYNECDRLYFEELSLETVLDIWEQEKPIGIIISVGGQIPNKLAMQLHEAGVNVLGTSPLSVDTAENRHKFSQLLNQLGIDQPEWQELTSLEEAKAFAQRVQYPVLVRPSYVLSGAAMAVASNDIELTKFLKKATDVSERYPVVMSKFVENAKELEIDAVACHGELVASAISEHVENAGVHSGDATLVLPPQRTYLETMRRIRKITAKIAEALKIHGPFNIQFIAKGNEVKVIECNLRASRSFPFVSKVLKVNFIDMATRVVMGQAVPKLNGSAWDLEYVGVKAPQFSFMRLDGADPTLGVEMASTGEVGCLGADFDEAFLKALLAVGYHLPVRSVLLSTGPVENKAAFLGSAKLLRDLGICLYATRGTAEFLQANGIAATVLRWPLEKQSPNAIEFLMQRKVDLVINIPKNYHEEELTNDYIIRRQAVDFGIPLITNSQLAQRFVEAIAHKRLEELEIKSWAEYERSVFPSEIRSVRPELSRTVSEAFFNSLLVP
ncbi:MAG: carbamoyl-phosphate synthase (glutamine-hydrolyzing) large subunit [Deltaproteobacteria bacterium]|nr:carbamoyl-phosphate synthase (glutamine-hydrolyzing) large subunit [Deltaproteobacteria bacterium]